MNLNLRISQKQILTPGLVQLVSVLALNKLELREMINQEIVENPVLEEAADEHEGEGVVSVEELAAAEQHVTQAADREIMEALDTPGIAASDADPYERFEPLGTTDTVRVRDHEAESLTDSLDGAPPDRDPFQEIDFGSFFEEYLDPGFRTPAAEDVEKPSFENFLATPSNLNSHLLWQLSLSMAGEATRSAAESIIGNLNDDGYLSSPLEEIAGAGGHSAEEMRAALAVVHEFDPIGVAARDLRECLLLQLRAIGMEGSTVWQVVSEHLTLVQNKQWKEIAKALGRPVPVVEQAVEFLKRLDPRPGQRYNRSEPRLIEPDVFIVKVGDDYQVLLNEDDVPQLRLNLSYRRLLNRGESEKEVREYIKGRYSSAMQLMKNIEQRKQTIMKVCQSVVARQKDFLANGIDSLKPMMIKEVAEEVGVHPSTVSRAVANKYSHTPQGVYELRYFFSEAVAGPQGHETSLLVLKRKVKKMIEEEDPARPLTDDQITKMLHEQGIDVTRRTVAKYREDLKIPSTHQRRVKP